MAWKKSSPPSAAPSTLSKILPLVVLFVVLAALAVVGFLVYSAVNNIASSANKQLEKKQILFGKDGVKVSVNHVEDEQYVDRTQSVLVKAWNLSSSKASKGDFLNKEGQTHDSRKPWSASK